MARIQFAPNATLAGTIEDVVLSVEAEYGSIVIEGSAYTAAHHTEAYRDRPAPCNDTDIPTVGKDDVILVSHVDLDTFGGCLRGVGRMELFTSEHQGFWDLAQFVDLNGPHKLGQSGADEADILRLYSFWAWAKTLPRLPRDEIMDVTQIVMDAGDALARILAGDEAMLQAGQAFRDEETALNQRTFRRLDGKVIVRVAEVAADFCNHLYTTPDGESAAAVACLNTEFGSVTISLADPIEGVSCCDIVQALWGPEAGGHPGIAGSPRGAKMDMSDLGAVVRRLNRVV